jgi:hypothetical protein
MKNSILVTGDIAALAVLTAIGFASHGETDISFVPRAGATFLPALAAWFLLAPWFGMFDKEIITKPKSFWRIPLAMLLAAPLIAVIRAALLDSTASPLFALILGSSFALGILIWRSAYFAITRKRDSG